MTIVFVILAAAVIMLVTDLLRIDMIALLVLLALAWSGVLTPAEALAGFSSHTVMAMIALMIMGRGITQTGMMDRFSDAVIRLAGTSRSKTVAMVFLAAGSLSAFIQNVGSAVLFLPAVLGISRREKISRTDLIMPLGFAAILGGTLTMTGSGPLILTNDFLRSAGLAPFNLFAVTPIGLLLLLCGFLLFLSFGRFLLPRNTAAASRSPQQELIEAWSLPFTVHHAVIPPGNALIGKNPEQIGIWSRYRLNILGMGRDKTVAYAPWRQSRFEAGQALALLGEDDSVERFVADFGLRLDKRQSRFRSFDDPGEAGFAEVIVPPRSALDGATIRQYNLRRRFGVEPVALFHRGELIRGDLSDVRISGGDTFIVHGLWEKIGEMKIGGDFVLVNPPAGQKKDRSKVGAAALFFAFSIVLTFLGLPISISFLSGAVAMILARVLSFEDAYGAVDWKVVFFIAGMIPLGAALQKTGAAALLSKTVMAGFSGAPTLILLAAISAVSTLFSLFMSNIAAMVILAPLAIGMANVGGLDPRPLLLLVALSTSNSFVLPTHQVNALLKSFGGYRSRDYLKAGSAMTIAFHLIVVVMISLFY